MELCRFRKGPVMICHKSGVYRVAPVKYPDGKVDCIIQLGKKPGKSAIWDNPYGSVSERGLKAENELGQLPPPHGHVVDVGCGTGQSTTVFCHYFRKVIGCDISCAQIEVAERENKHSNVSYLVCPAYSIPLPDHSVELVSAVASMHWFDIEKFFREARRLLKQNGVLAIQSYHYPILLFDTEVKNDIAKRLMKKLLDESLVDYWSPRVQINKNEFLGFQFPFNEVVRYSGIRSERSVTVDDVIGYITSFSSYQTMKEEEPDKLDFIMQDFEDRILELAGGREEIFTFARDHFLILCRDNYR